MRRIPTLVACCVAFGLAGSSTALAQDSAGDTGEAPDPALSSDDDGDSFAEDDGDCDDDDAEVFPGQIEVCFDEIDNDCNGLFDDGCDGSAYYGTLRGGGGCTGGTGVGNTAALWLPLLLAPWLWRRAQR
jgi:hypothetical protein